MAPSGPEPVRRSNAMPRSAASRRAAGEAATCKATPTGAAAVPGVTGTTAGGAAGTRGFAAGDATAGEAAAGAAGAVPAAAGAAGAAAVGAGAAGATTAGSGTAVGAGCPAAPVSSRAITVPTGNFVPTGTTSSDTTPGLNTSISIAPFCVSTTAMTSPRLTRSPGFTSHSTSVPASMSAPRDGMRKSVIGRMSPRCRHEQPSPPPASCRAEARHPRFVASARCNVVDGGCSPAMTPESLRRLLPSRNNKSCSSAAHQVARRSSDRRHLRQRRLFHLRGVRDRHFGRTDTPDRPIEIEERGFANPRGDLG